MGGGSNSPFCTTYLLAHPCHRAYNSIGYQGSLMQSYPHNMSQETPKYSQRLSEATLNNFDQISFSQTRTFPTNFFKCKI